MNKLIKYECQKFFCKRSLLIITFILLLINLTKIYTVYKEDTYLGIPNWRDVYDELYCDFSGRITVDKIKNLLEMYVPLEEKIADHTANTRTNDENMMTGNVYSDRHLLKWLYVNPMEYMFSYQNNSNEIIKKANENILFYSKFNNTYEIQKNKKISSIFKGRKVINFEYTEMVNSYTHYDFSCLLALLIILYGITTIFFYEKESKMNYLLLTNKNGGNKTIVAKILSVSIFITVVTGLFCLFDLLGFVFSYKTSEGLGLPYYALRDFEQSIFSNTIFIYFLTNTLMRIIGFWSLGMLFLFIALIIKKPLMIFSINLILTFILYNIGMLYSNSSNVFIKSITPYSLLINRILLGNTEFVNILNIPVSSVSFSVVFNVVIGFCYIVLIICLSEKNTSARGGIPWKFSSMK